MTDVFEARAREITELRERYRRLIEEAGNCAWDDLGGAYSVAAEIADRALALLEISVKYPE